MKVQLTLEKHEVLEAVRLYLQRRQNLTLSQNIKMKAPESITHFVIEAELQNKTQETINRNNETKN